MTKLNRYLINYFLAQLERWTAVLLPVLIMGSEGFSLEHFGGFLRLDLLGLVLTFAVLIGGSTVAELKGLF